LRPRSSSASPWPTWPRSVGNELRKTVYAALVAAFLGSIGVAIVISRTHLNEDVFEGWVMLVAAFFVITMVIFMMKTGRKLKGEIEGKVGLLAATTPGSASSFSSS
jgi:high-affinity iron transporter